MEMQKNKVRDYSFTILLAVSFLIVGIAWVSGVLQTLESQAMSRTFTEKTDKISQGLRVEIQGLTELFFPGQVVAVSDNVEETEGIVIPENLGIIEENSETEAENVVEHRWGSIITY